MREIVLDTETTGLDPMSGDRIVEIGCVELINHMATENTYWQYINPECNMPAEAHAIHGLTTEFLSDMPPFANIAEAFLEFIGDAPLIIHNAKFDIGFINAELTRADFLPLEIARAIDTIQLARSKFPGAPASLDALCRRFKVDNSGRELHGALKDAHLLACVYLELVGGRQPNLDLSKGEIKTTLSQDKWKPKVLHPRPHAASTEELAAHEIFIKQLSNPIWKS